MTILTKVSIQIFDPNYPVRARSGFTLEPGVYTVSETEAPGIQKGMWFLLPDGLGSPKEIWEWASGEDPNEFNYPSIERV